MTINGLTLELKVEKYNRLNYRSFTDLNDLIKRNFWAIPKDIDLVVGIPRSGILPATLISLYSHKPFISLNELLTGSLPLSGERISNLNIQKDKIKILLVDDSINSGKAMERAKNQLIEFRDKYSIISCAVFATPDSRIKVDHFFEVLENPRIFEWNILRSWIFSNSCVDIDGVLCDDPTDEENDDGEKYIQFLLNATPKVIPKAKIKYLVTSRLEKYRNETEIWLNKNGVQYEELIMLDLPSKEERQRRNCHGRFKASVYYRKRYSSILFIESSKNQSLEINEITKLPVFCTGSMELFDSFKSIDIQRFKVYSMISKLKRKLF